MQQVLVVYGSFIFRCRFASEQGVLLPVLPRRLDVTVMSVLAQGSSPQDAAELSSCWFKNRQKPLG